jgi:hypothetical protein
MASTSPTYQPSGQFGSYDPNAQMGANPNLITPPNNNGLENFADTANNNFANTNTLSPTNLLPGQHTLDSGSQQQISNQLNQFASPEDMTAQYTNGMGNAQGFLSGGNISSLGGGAGAQSQALQARGQQMFQQGLGNMKQNIALQSPTNLSNYYSKVGANLAANEQLKNANYQQQVQYMQQLRATNNAYNQALNQGSLGVLGSIIGGIGAAAGVAAAI